MKINYCGVFYSSIVFLVVLYVGTIAYFKARGAGYVLDYDKMVSLMRNSIFLVYIVFSFLVLSIAVMKKQVKSYSFLLSVFAFYQAVNIFFFLKFLEVLE